MYSKLMEKVAYEYPISRHLPKDLASNLVQLGEYVDIPNELYIKTIGDAIFPGDFRLGAHTDVFGEGFVQKGALLPRYGRPLARFITGKLIPEAKATGSKKVLKQLYNLKDEVERRVSIGEKDFEMTNPDMFLGGKTIVDTATTHPWYFTLGDAAYELAPGMLAAGIGGALAYRPIKELIKAKSLSNKGLLRLLASGALTGGGLYLVEKARQKLLSRLKSRGYVNAIRKADRLLYSLPERMKKTLRRAQKAFYEGKELL